MDQNTKTSQPAQPSSQAKVPSAPAQPQAPVGLAQPADSSATPITKIVFYCKDCDKLVMGEKMGRKYVYRCPVCKTKNVAFGTEKSIRSFYHVA